MAEQLLAEEANYLGAHFQHIVDYIERKRRKRILREMQAALRYRYR